MPLIKYESFKFSSHVLERIDQANSIIQEYEELGFTLTLRQLYYQFVARGLMENVQKNYKQLGDTMNNARLAGLVDWNAMVDLTRNVLSYDHWATPERMIADAIDDFRIDLWKNQSYRPEVWIEKQALIGVIQDVCSEYDVPYFACRGYNSQSEQWRAGRRMKRHMELRGQVPYVIHLGDHDPSGIDMTKDNANRLWLFAEGDAYVHRIALNMSQVEQYSPPPNPAKVTDSRYGAYVRMHGESSWELDALSPPVISKLISDTLDTLIDPDEWQKSKTAQENYRDELSHLVDNYDDVKEWLSKGGYENDD